MSWGKKKFMLEGLDLLLFFHLIELDVTLKSKLTKMDTILLLILSVEENEFFSDLSFQTVGSSLSFLTLTQCRP